MTVIPVLFTGLVDHVGARQGNVLGSDTTLPGWTGGLGDYTDDNQPELQGTAAPGATVAVTVGGVRIGTTTADASGQWHLIPATPLANGSDDLTAWALAPDGSYDYADPTQSARTSLYVDASLPAPAGSPVITGVLDDIGPVQGDLIGHSALYLFPATDDNRPTLTGTAPPGALLSIRIAGVLQSDTVLADSTGHWRYTPDNPIPNGPQAIAAIIPTPYGDLRDDVVLTVAAGNMSPPVITDAIDQTGAPIAAGRSTSERLPTLHGTAEPGVGVDLYDNSALVGHTTAGADSRWSFTPAAPLTDTSTHTFAAVAIGTGITTGTDTAGSTNTPAPYTYDLVINGVSRAPLAPVITGLVDDVGPLAGTITLSPGVTDDVRTTLQGSAEPGTQVEVIDNGVLIGATTTRPDWQWSYTPTTDLASGGHALTVQAWAADRVAGTAGVYAFHVEVNSDQQAMPAPVITDVVYTEQHLTGRVPDGGATDHTHLTLQGTAAPGTRIDVYDNAQFLGNALTSTDWHWQFTPTADLDPGAQAFTVHANWLLDGTAGAAAASAYTLDVGTDAVSLRTPVITALLDNIGPVQGPIDPTTVTDDSTPTLQGTGQPGAVIEVYGNGIDLGHTTVGADWQWSFTPATPLLDSQEFSVRAVSPDGHAAVPAQTVVSTYIVHHPPTSTLTPPTLTALLDHQGLQQGRIDLQQLDTYYTDDTQPTFLGRADPGVVVELLAETLDGRTGLGFATTGADGVWSLTPAKPLPLDPTLVNHLTTVAHDPADAANTVSNTVLPSLVIAADSLHVADPVVTSILDNVGPVQGPLPLTGDAVTDDTQPIFSGTATPGTQVDMLAEWSDASGQYDSAYLFATIADAQGRWTGTTTEPIPAPTGTPITLTLMAEAPAGVVPSSWFTPLPGTLTLDTLLTNAGLVAQTPATSTATDAGTPAMASQAQAAALGLPAALHDLAY